MHTSPLDHLVEVFGSQSAIARIMGVGQSTVSMWKRNGVPDHAKWRLMRIAQDRGLKLDPRRLDERDPEPAP